MGVWCSKLGCSTSLHSTCQAWQQSPTQLHQSVASFLLSWGLERVPGSRPSCAWNMRQFFGAKGKDGSTVPVPRWDAHDTPRRQLSHAYTCTYSIYIIYIYMCAWLYIYIYQYSISFMHSLSLGQGMHDTIRTCQALFFHQALHNPGQVAKPCAGTFGRIDGEFRPCHGIAGLGSLSGLRDERLKKHSWHLCFFLDVFFWYSDVSTVFSIIVQNFGIKYPGDLF